MWRVSHPEFTEDVTTYVNRALLGRDVNNEIVLNDIEVSRKHVMLVSDNKFWWVVDLKSKNGTRVNGELVHCHKLMSKDVITLGETTVVKL
jgi:pSer/pThr/pTyr-binding forkhead associated (FHA) protein